MDVTLTSGFTQRLAQLLAELNLPACQDCQVLPGGSTCAVYALRLQNRQSYVCKYRTGMSDDFFTSQAQSLVYLRERGVLVPEVIAHGADYLLLSHIDGQIYAAAQRQPGSKQHREQTRCKIQALGASLARLHMHVQTQFGFIADNYCGSCRQVNTWRDSWPEFFWLQRIEPLLQHPAMHRADHQAWLRFANKLPTWLSHNPQPRLCHGDAWPSNFIWSNNNRVYMLDPACAYQDVAMDWVYWRYFNMLCPVAERAYTEILQPVDYLSSVAPIYQLYLLLVHLHQCGQQYLSPLRRALNYCVGLQLKR